MSVDLAVWEGPKPESAETATRTFAELYERYVESGDEVSPTPAIAAYVAALLERWPDLPDVGDDDDESPWSDGPLLGDASGPFMYFGLVMNELAEEAWRYSVETAGAMGLVAFDPQSGALANPDPHAPASPSPAPEPRSGRESRSRFGRLPGFRRRS